nr:hypothetical protein [Tanacetum cinerariifolium]
MRSIISMVSISLEGFLPFIFLLVVIIVAVVIVAVILVVVVIDAIVEVVVGSSVSSINKLSPMIVESSRTGLLPSGRDMIHNELSNFTKIDSLKRLSGVVDLTSNDDPSDEDGGTGMGDLT